MPIKVGDRLPQATFRVMTPDGPKPVTSDEVFKGKTVAVFGMPGAYTGSCHKKHLPTVLQNVDALRKKGIDTVVVTTTNDHFVMDVWKRDNKADTVEFLADGNGEFVKGIDLLFDGTGIGFGTVRSQRYSMLVEDGVVKKLNVEQPGKFEVSGGDVLLGQI